MDDANRVRIDCCLCQPCPGHTRIGRHAYHDACRPPALFAWMFPPRLAPASQRGRKGA